MTEQQINRISEIRKKIDRMMLVSSLLVSLLILYHIGYNTDFSIERLIVTIITYTCYGFAFLSLVRVSLSFLISRKITILHSSEIVLFIYLSFITLLNNTEFAIGDLHLVPVEWMYLGIFSVFIIELSKSSMVFDKFYFNPTLLFVLSFLGMILIGSMLLMLPNSTVGRDLSFVDAVFMATSAVCITGLSVVDISSRFTEYGQIVLITLVQLGGLGIMTFTGFFGYFFSGGFSFKSQVMYTELIGENKVASVIRTLYKIIFITLFFELIGAVLLYITIDPALFINERERIYFSIFHAISTFCNAGFSTLPAGLHHDQIRFDYPLLLIFTGLFFLGGLGFGIVFNTYNFIKKWTVSFYRKIIYGESFKFKAWIIGFNSRIIWYTSVFLTLFGLITVFIFESRNSLAEHNLGGQIVSALFIGSAPRSAGYNIIEMTHLTTPSIMIIMLLMWIGTAPGSTGGGIKITTFAVAILNIASIARGKDRVEIFKREISPESIRRAFSIISLSLLSLGISVLLMSITDGEKGLFPLAFECFSAYGTVGLSLGITPELSNAGKIILVFTMFIGRVGTLTLLIALIKNTHPKTYHYPSENMTY